MNSASGHVPGSRCQGDKYLDQLVPSPRFQGPGWEGTSETCREMGLLESKYRPELPPGCWPQCAGMHSKIAVYTQQQQSPQPDVRRDFQGGRRPRVSGRWWEGSRVVEIGALTPRGGQPTASPRWQEACVQVCTCGRPALHRGRRWLGLLPPLPSHTVPTSCRDRFFSGKADRPLPAPSWFPPHCWKHTREAPAVGRSPDTCPLSEDKLGRRPSHSTRFT